MTKRRLMTEDEHKAANAEFWDSIEYDAELAQAWDEYNDRVAREQDNLQAEEEARQQDNDSQYPYMTRDEMREE